MCKTVTMLHLQSDTTKTCRSVLFTPCVLLLGLLVYCVSSSAFYALSGVWTLKTSQQTLLSFAVSCSLISICLSVFHPLGIWGSAHFMSITPTFQVSVPSRTKAQTSLCNSVICLIYLYVSVGIPFFYLTGLLPLYTNLFWPPLTTFYKR